MGEFDLIARYFTRPVRKAALGVGDDCALLAPAPGMQLAISSDMLFGSGGGGARGRGESGYSEGSGGGRWASRACTSARLRNAGTLRATQRANGCASLWWRECCPQRG